MNKKRLILLIIPYVVLLFWIIFLFVQKMSGYNVILPIQGYDPRDLISGHYIQYQIDWKQSDCSQFEGNKCPKNDFCISHRWGRQCRFYVSEKYAGKLDKLFRQRNENLRFEVIYSYQKDKQAMAKELLINGKNWLDFIKENKIDN